MHSLLTFAFARPLLLFCVPSALGAVLLPLPPQRLPPKRHFCSTTAPITNTTTLCPTTPEWSGECPFLSRVLPPRRPQKTPPQPPPSTNPTNPSRCSSPVSILTILAVVTIIEAASTLMQGHDRVRRQLFRLRGTLFRLPDKQSPYWTPASGTVSAFTTFLFQVLLPAIISWSENKSQFSFGSLLGMWTMRPRGTFVMFALMRLIGWGGFKFTAFDAIVTESILDVIALPFAVTAVLTDHGPDGEGAKGCGIQGYEAVEDDVRVGMVYASFGWGTAAGVISSLVLAQFVIMSFNKRLTQEEMAEKDEEEAWQGRWSWWGRVLLREKRQLVPIIVAMGTMISNWVLWGRTGYCEAQDGVATLVLGIIHQLFIPLLRACFGADPDLVEYK
ncbi:predicted protein [Chaetomium globosum CBS 148.51]|uniref:Solute carrier family 40 protein n=1 Tax=Chaetomium globosum (strain ATCC 6205 / CBS 148.51 / DSM 1962 / NBRC 6347 / NRRL 1970) TaxID=306901 RepID=Q2GTZ1_CHAGB|nr:uncharacterized protein CHGG_08563 [Chaetomium globosum CBS 148.51]EAQ84549.1 predicted protein [Chaetomium globosum CBS 148.51]